MIGVFEGYSDNDQIFFCPKCGEEIKTFYGDGSASCKKCNSRFAEIEQSKSAFVFRLRKDDSQGVTAALFEADGAAWKHEAIDTIQKYLINHLDGQPVIILA